MLSFFSRVPSSRIWWLSLGLFCFSLEAVALYYQYQLNYAPCVLCVHVRMLLALLILISVIGFLGVRSRIMSLLAFLFATGIWLWLVERSYQLLGVERGWIIGECGMDSGLPSWLKLGEWFPSLFKILEPCGYTPYVFSNITMAESLLVMSILFSLFCLFSLLRMIIARKSENSQH